MKGLIVKAPWIHLILNGEKIWEIRGTNNVNIRGTIALIQSGTGNILGTVDIVDCKPLTLEELDQTIDKHCVPKSYPIKYPKIFAWVLKNPKRFKEPVSYIHPQGAVIWVNLSDEVVQQFCA